MVGRSDTSDIRVEPRGWELSDSRDTLSTTGAISLIVDASEPALAKEDEIRWDIPMYCQGHAPPPSSDAPPLDDHLLPNPTPISHEQTLREAARKCGHTINDLIKMLLDEMLIADIRDVADLMALDHVQLDRPQLIQALVELSLQNNLTRDMMEATVYFAKLTALRELMLNLGLSASGERTELLNTLQELLTYIPDASMLNIDLYHHSTGRVPEKGKIIGYLEAPKDQDIAHLLELGAVEAYKKEAHTLRQKLKLL
jgi:hypothetical protein